MFSFEARKIQLQTIVNSRSIVPKEHCKSTAHLSYYTHSTMAGPVYTSRATSPSYISDPFTVGQTSPSVGPAITSDPAPLPSSTRVSTSMLASFTLAPGFVDHNQSATSTPPRTDTGLSDSRLTAIIVVPIVLIAILSPIFIVWCISRRRRGKIQRHSRWHSSQEAKLLGQERAKSMTESAPEDRPQRRSFRQQRSTTSLPPHRRKPARSLEQRRSARQLRTSHIPNHSLSGFNFDFSRRATMFSARSTQPTVRDPTARPSSTNTWIITPPSDPRSPTFAHLCIPPRIQTPQPTASPPSLSETGPPAQTHSSSPNSPSILLPTHPLPPPETCGKVHTRNASRPLNDENLAALNSSTLTHPISQPHPVDAVSEVSGLSFDRSLCVATQRQDHRLDDRDAMSEVSALEPDPDESMHPHQLV